MSARWVKRNMDPKWAVSRGNSSARKKASRSVVSASVRAFSVCWSSGPRSLRWVRTARAAAIDRGCWMYVPPKKVVSRVGRLSSPYRQKPPSMPSMRSARPAIAPMG